jgi:hypothetical protein
MFTQGGILNVLIYVIGDSNVGLMEGNLATFDLLTLPGQILFLNVLIAYLGVHGELISEAIGGPDRGRNKVPMGENRVVCGLVTIFAIIPLYLILLIFFPVLTNSFDHNSYSNIYVPWFNEAYKVVETSNIIVAGYIGFNMLWATLLFEGKITQKQFANLALPGIFVFGDWKTNIRVRGCDTLHEHLD